MHLIQVLLPVYDNAGKPLPADLHQRVGNDLTRRFGGLTAYTRAPAQGLWKGAADHVHSDDIVIYEVMTHTVDTAWWREYRHVLEELFRQEHIVIRAQEIVVL
jgi:hypothetical protein